MRKLTCKTLMEILPSDILARAASKAPLACLCRMRS